MAQPQQLFVSILDDPVTQCFRLNKSEKVAFVAWCKTLGTTPSARLRELVQQDVAANPSLFDDLQPASADNRSPAAGGAAGGEQDVRSNTAHLSQNGNLSVLDVACPKCGAPVGEKCRKPNGKVADAPHVERRIVVDFLRGQAND